MYKGILLDIDNTLYDYASTHAIAKKVLFDEISQRLDRSIEEVEQLYAQARETIHNKLHSTASSHNRLLYIQRLFELAHHKALTDPLELYRLYWDTFIGAIRPFSGVYEFLTQLHPRPICLLTDLTADVQFQKVRHLQLDRYVTAMVTSEEVGKEKPHRAMFDAALSKLQLHSQDVCMIGDNFDKDILGAQAQNIHAFWLTQHPHQQHYNPAHITPFQTFEQLTQWITLP